MDIAAFHYSQVDKSILWTVIGCFSHVTGSVLSYRPFYFFSASWTLAGKSCYCCLFYMLEQ